jgi:hypothetical protein
MFLSYDPATGHFMWRQRRGGRAVAGAEAGSINNRGYRWICIDGCLYLAHRLAWLYVYGVWPSAEIDHIDGDPANNRLANLREATRAENGRNLRRRADNTSGAKGVCFEKSVGRWRASINVNGSQRHLGYFNTVKDATAAYDAAALRHHGEFARVNGRRM